MATKKSQPAALAETDVAAELVEARREIVRLRGLLAQKERAAHGLERQVRSTDDRAKRYVRQLADLRNSMSWRVTRPLRVFRRRAADDIRSAREQ